MILSRIPVFKFYDFPDIFDYAMGSPASTDEMICKNVFDHQVYVGRFVIILTHGSEPCQKPCPVGAEPALYHR